jgi:hypothetical protein
MGGRTLTSTVDPTATSNRHSEFAWSSWIALFEAATAAGTAVAWCKG